MEALLNINPIFYIMILFILVVILIMMTIHLNSKLSRLTKRYEKFMKGKNAEDLDGLMHDMLHKMDKIERAHQRSMIKIDEGLNSIGSTWTRR